MEHRDSEAFRGATFRECDLRDVRIVGSAVDGMSIEAFGGELGTVLVEGVDVSPYVAAQLDLRVPERVAVREARTVAELRAALDQVEAAWRETRARAERLEPGLLDAQVDDEWSFTQTLRHLVFATDVWIHRMLAEQDAPFDPLGLAPTDYSEAGSVALGLRPQAEPSYDDVVAAHDRALAAVRTALDGLVDADLDTPRTGVPAPEWGEETYPARQCPWIVLKEHTEHRRYALRDLAVLEAG